MKISRRQALRQLMGGAGAAAFATTGAGLFIPKESRRRIWQVGVTLDSGVETGRTSGPALPDPRREIAMDTETAEGPLLYDFSGAPFSDSHLRPYQRATLAAETGRREGPSDPSQECRRAWENRIVVDETHRLPASDPMEIGRRIHEQVERGMKGGALEGDPKESLREALQEARERGADLANSRGQVWRCKSG